MVKVDAHQDTKIHEKGEFKGRKKTYAEMTIHERGNYYADLVVTENRKGYLTKDIAPVTNDTRGKMWGGQRGKAMGPAQVQIGWGGRWCTGNRLQQTTEHVKLQTFQRRLETTEYTELQNKSEIWNQAREWACAQHLKGAWWGPMKARRVVVQAAHGLLPTRVQMARREYPCEIGEQCPASAERDSQWHVIGCCKHPDSCRARDEGSAAVYEITDNANCTQDTRLVLEHIYGHKNGSWDRRVTAAPDVDARTAEGKADTVLFRNVEALGGEQIWAGTVPRGLHGRLVHKGPMSDEKAPKLITALAKAARDAAHEVWKVRCAWSTIRKATRKCGTCGGGL